MTRITILPHGEICPQGAAIEAEEGKTLCDALLANDIEIEHACAQSCACGTCHVLVRAGFETLPSADDCEEDLLDKAWGLEACSRLACRVIVTKAPLTVEIPRYSINLARENQEPV
ncbi:MAG: ISC system 2Fe-2S type ferredoxin [Zoogloeaceae bacterium]|jgi:2Fe-2S ferredoxin|nr:ISC system 2Fe-2S type ferredoxin [Zoogloeaceae bacterium]